MGALENYKRARQQTAPLPDPNGGGKDLIGLVIVLAIVCLLFLPRMNWGGDRDRQQDHQEQVQPVNGGILVFVSEKQAPTVEEELLMRAMPGFAKSRGLEQFLWLDDEEDASENLREYAQSKSISPPLVAYVKDRKIKRVAKWPANQAELEKFLK